MPSRSSLIYWTLSNFGEVWLWPLKMAGTSPSFVCSRQTWKLVSCKLFPPPFLWQKSSSNKITEWQPLTCPPQSWPGSVLVPRTDQFVPKNKKDFLEVEQCFFQTIAFLSWCAFLPDVSHRPQARWTWRPQLQRHRKIMVKVLWPEVEIC